MPDKLGKMLGKFRRVTGCILLVVMAICGIAILGPTETEYATLVHLSKGTFMKYLKHDAPNTSREIIPTMQKANNIRRIKNQNDNKQFSRHNITASSVKTKGNYSPLPRTKPLPEVLPEIRHIAFLKVHKAASSTMQNIFFRFGLQRNLTFVFTVHPNYFSRTALRHLPLVKPKYRQSYDIICTHSVFNYDIYSSLLPSDTVYIASVRDPLAVFISAVNYYTQPSQQISYIARIRGNRLQKLIQKPEVYDKEFFSYTKNVMARDFGFPETNDEERVQAKLKELGETFKLVLLVEYFEESLILMKRYLRWKLKDILFLSNNVYGKGQTAEDLTSADVSKFKIRNKLDYKIYDYFYTKFWDQFNQETDDIKSEVTHFRKVLSEMNKFCNEPIHAKGKNSVLQVELSKWNEPFIVTSEDCSYAKKDELKFITLLRKRQGSELRG